MFHITSFLSDRDYMFLMIYQRVIVLWVDHQPFETALRASSGRTGGNFVMYREPEVIRSIKTAINIKDIKDNSMTYTFEQIKEWKADFDSIQPNIDGNQIL